LKKALQLLLILVCSYFLILTIAIVWTFEVKLQRWPIFIYAAPFTIQVGDDINRIRLFERLSRQGYIASPVSVPEPGEWGRSGSGITIFLKDCPFKQGEITSGPINLTLDWDQIKSIRLMRSLEEVNRIALEPELVQVVPPPGYFPELCRSLPLNQIPSLLVDAIVLTEDPRFFLHSGIDLVSVQQALMTNLKAWRYVQGGSTIPQQLVRMTMLSPEKTLGRKISEVFLALTAGILYSKERILEAYLNRVYYGQWGTFPIKGVPEAARHLFGKALTELDAAECALMAAMIRAPSVINPYLHPERTLARRNMVLGLLFKAGKISREIYDEAINRPVVMKKPSQVQMKTGAFVKLVKDRLPAQMPGPAPKEPRQDVLTSLDPLIQNDTERLLKPLGEAGSQAHFVLANPQSGNIMAFIAPGSDNKWSGVGGNADTLLPLIMVPAFVPERPAQAKYTLTSTLFISTKPGGQMTFREAYRHDRGFLLRNLVNSLGAEKVIPVLREFGARAHQTADSNLAVDALAPVDLAQIYAHMATLGNAGTIGPGIHVIGWSSASEQSQNRRISVSPTAIYMVNHLMKSAEATSAKEGYPSKTIQQPSFFTARDDQGLWGVAYQNDALLVLRLPGNPFSDSKMQKLIARILPIAGQAPDSALPVPEGLVFRKICIDSGLLATSICPRVVQDPFFKGTQPVEWCPHRHEPTSARSGAGNKKQPMNGARNAIEPENRASSQ